jgi:hypothetical protein
VGQLGSSQRVVVAVTKNANDGQRRPPSWLTPHVQDSDEGRTRADDSFVDTFDFLLLGFVFPRVFFSSVSKTAVFRKLHKQSRYDP